MKQLQVKQGNVIKLAVAAAGGRTVIARELGVSPWTVSGWQRNQWIPPDKIRQLCAMGGNLVSVDQVLEYIEAGAAERSPA